MNSTGSGAVLAARGAIFETFVFAELLKAQLHTGAPERIHFWRDYAGHEVDFVLGTRTAPLPVEAKSGKTVTQDAFKGLRFWAKVRDERAGEGIVVYGGDHTAARSGGRIVSWRELPVG